MLGQPECCQGRLRFIALSVFWVSSCPQPASERSVGPQSRLQLVGLERMEATLLASGPAQPGCFGPSFPQTLNIQRAQLAWHSEAAIVSLVTHLPQTPLEILDKVGSRDICSFIPVVKHLVFVHGSLKSLAPQWKRSSAGRAWGR